MYQRSCVFLIALLLGLLAVAIFFAAWQAAFLVFPFNPLFISKPDLIGRALVNLLLNGDMLRDLVVSAVPFFYGFSAAVVVGVPLGIVAGRNTVSSSGFANVPVTVACMYCATIAFTTV